MFMSKKDYMPAVLAGAKILAEIVCGARGRRPGRSDLKAEAMCVGASSMARKCLLENKDLAGAEAWASKAVKAFHEFEKLDPDWFNINPFYATALAVLGNESRAAASYKDKYRKQKAGVNEQEFADFREELSAISVARKR